MDSIESGAGAQTGKSNFERNEVFKNKKIKQKRCSKDQVVSCVIVVLFTLALLILIRATRNCYGDYVYESK